MIKRIAYASIGIVFMASAGLFAGQYGRATLVTGAQDPSQINATINGVINNMNAIAPGLLFSQPTTVATATGTAEQFLATYNLPAGYLANVGQAIRVKATFSYAANTQVKTPKLYFGTSAITGTANSTSGATASLTCDIVKSGTATQNVQCTGMDAAVDLTNAFTSGTDDDTAAIAIRASCTDGTSSAADCNLRTMLVESIR